MTADDFVYECTKRGIDPAIALENDNVCRAIKDRLDGRVKRILDTEF